MKIIGFSYIDGSCQMVLKGDSCLLVNRKPFFTPDWTNDVRAHRCVVLRVSRLGKSIAPRFANRYYDAKAEGLDFVAWDKWQTALERGESWTEAMCFDYSLAVGSWLSVEGLAMNDERLAMPIDEAIARVSDIMTIRQGDLIYIPYKDPARKVEREEVIEGEGLYCKIK
ncbi:MAG: hypothetical protein J5612_04890 [Paludibacteraceae bacterium]|nr:hypothetical protein [Paludibacteraceae bacterium]